MTISLKADPSGTFGELLINGTPAARLDAAGFKTPTNAPYFKRDNILGTVSQSGGVPTGAVIERGSNANGEYVRFADGTQICTLVIESNQTTTAATGSVFATSSDLSIRTFPAPFITIPYTEISVSGLDSVSQIRWVVAGAVGTTTSSWPAYRIADSVSGVGLVQIQFLAIGRWW